MNISQVKTLFLACILVFSCVLSADVLAAGTAVETDALLIATASSESTACSAPAPILLGAVPGDGQITITWSDEHTGNHSVTGYNIYFDKDGQSQPVTSVWPQTMFTHAGLTNGQEYCYKITALHEKCESGFSNIICAVPAVQAP